CFFYSAIWLTTIPHCTGRCVRPCGVHLINLGHVCRNHSRYWGYCICNNKMTPYEMDKIISIFRKSVLYSGAN
ncbi:hypothetical protein F5146DRAFT_1022151, partial [Armillaria mellea]